MSRDSGRLTCVVVTYDGTRYIGGCLTSLLSDGVEAGSIVVVDNASTDGTPELVRRAYSGVRVVELTENLGYGGGANVGAAYGDGRYVLVLNQDVVVAPGCVERLVAALDTTPSAMLANPKILLHASPDLVNTCGNTLHYTGITVCRGYGRPSAAYVGTEPIPVISGAAFVARREVFDALGGFDPSFFLYLEDTDLSLRAVLAGYECLLVSDAVIYHDFEPRFAPEKLFWLERNRLAMLLKTYRWRTLTALAPALLLTEGLVLGYSALRGRPGIAAKLRAYGWVATHLPTILEARRGVQATRRISDRRLLERAAGDLELEELRHPLGQAAMRLVNPLFRAWLSIGRLVAR